MRNAMTFEGLVLDEEIIIHPNCEHKINGWHCTARVMGCVKIGGEKYYFDKQIGLRLKKAELEEDEQ
jgi:hypothetical protein